MGWLAKTPDRKALLYHNITPSSYFAGTNEAFRDAAIAGRKQLSTLASLVPHGWGVSDYNCRELAEAGWSQPRVLPIVFEPRRYNVRPDRRTLTQWQGGLNVLFVGRLSPNKRHEDLVLTFYHLKRLVRPDARLLLVGSWHDTRPYLEYLRALVDRLGLRDVVFAGHVDASELVAFYRAADVYLSMSEHEGFGVPLLESMHFSLPIVAYSAAAVPETLGGTGILFTSRDYRAVAELVAMLAEDESLRARVCERQQERLRDFLPNRAEERLRELLREVAA
jgi:glycosyltransferase involved in cell wall biosynthesis